MLIHRIRRLKQRVSLVRRTSAPISRDSIQRIALTLSDQKLITGASIMIVGFCSHCSLTQYHFKVIQLLGHVSFLTYQSTVMIVCEVLLDAPAKKHWRAIWNFAIFVLVAVCTVIVYSDNFLQSYGLSVQCIWNDLKYSSAINVVLLALLFWDLVATIDDLYPGYLDWKDCALREVFRYPGYLFVWTKRKSSKTKPQSLVQFFWKFASALSFLSWSLLSQSSCSRLSWIFFGYTYRCFWRLSLWRI